MRELESGKRSILDQNDGEGDREGRKQQCGHRLSVTLEGGRTHILPR